MSGRRIRCGKIALLNALLVLAGCNSSPRESSTRAPGGRATSNPAVTRAWDTFIRRYDSAVMYFNEYGTWGKRATQEQDEKAEADLSEALAGLAALTRSGSLSHAELSLVQQEVRDIDRRGGRRSRTVQLRHGGYVHSDGVPAWPGMRAHSQLQARLPSLREASNQDEHNRTVLKWILPKIRRRSDILAKPEVSRRVAVMNRFEPHWDGSGRPAVTAAELRQEILSLVLEIERKADLAPTR